MISDKTLTLTKRLRRNRRTDAIRSMVRETELRPSDFVAPYFVLPGENQRREIRSLPGHARLSIDHILRDIESLHAQGIPGVILFPVVPNHLKDNAATEAFNPDGILPVAIRRLKEELPSLCVIADVALDPFSSFGHDGLVDERGTILNDETVHALSDIALIYAQEGADYIAPSDMMDGRVGAIRTKLDDHHLTEVGIISYCAKYVSSFYAPFREALDSAPRIGEKHSYQLDWPNAREALIEAALDEEEGADILMVKPALVYLDILVKMREVTKLPLSAYHVTGEYAAIMAAHSLGYLDGPKALHESLMAIKRAGADFIFTYAIKQVLERLS